MPPSKRVGGHHPLPVLTDGVGVFWGGSGAPTGPRRPPPSQAENRGAKTVALWPEGSEELGDGGENSPPPFFALN